MKASAVLWLFHDLGRVRQLAILQKWWRENFVGRYLGEV